MKSVKVSYMPRFSLLIQLGRYYTHYISSLIAHIYTLNTKLYEMKTEPYFNNFSGFGPLLNFARTSEHKRGLDYRANPWISSVMNLPCPYWWPCGNMRISSGKIIPVRHLQRIGAGPMAT